MMTFDPRRADQGAAFDDQLARLADLVVDIGKIRSGMPPERLAGEAPILDRWVLSQRLTPCLAGLSTGHPVLSGENRLIATSDLWLISEDRQWARTLSRWYQLGRPGGTVRHDS